MTQHIKSMIDDFLRKLPKQSSRVAPHVKADLLLVNCIDCRYPHAIHHFMHTNYDYKTKVYDHLVLAGASLASTEVHTKNEHWAKTFEQHVGLSIDLHEIDGVLVLDHRTCGAYVKTGLLAEADHNTPREFSQHRMVAIDSAAIVGQVFKNKSRHAHIEYLLTPEIPLGTSDFPTRPELLWETDV